MVWCARTARCDHGRHHLPGGGHVHGAWRGLVLWRRWRTRSCWGRADLLRLAAAWRHDLGVGGRLPSSASSASAAHRQEDTATALSLLARLRWAWP